MLRRKLFNNVFRLPTRFHADRPKSVQGPRRNVAITIGQIQFNIDRCSGQAKQKDTKIEWQEQKGFPLAIHEHSKKKRCL